MATKKEKAPKEEKPAPEAAPAEPKFNFTPPAPQLCEHLEQVKAATGTAPIGTVCFICNPQTPVEPQAAVVEGNLAVGGTPLLAEEKISEGPGNPASELVNPNPPVADYRYEGKYLIAGSGVVNHRTNQWIPNGEPIFILRGRDALALQTIGFYLSRAMAAECPGEHLAAITERFEEFRKFKLANPDQIKMPD